MCESVSSRPICFVELEQTQSFWFGSCRADENAVIETTKHAPGLAWKGGFMGSGGIMQDKSLKWTSE